MPPKVSVIMPVYNGDGFLAEAIASILGQTYTDFELIIIDDGSTDGTADIIRKYAERDERIVPVMLDKNVGNASARNRGIERAKGEYIAAMDSDDISLPDRLRRQVDYLDANPHIGCLGANMHSLSQELKYTWTSNVPNAHCQIAWGTIMGGGMVGPLAMMRRAPLSAVGGYEEGRRMDDDLELWSRLIEKTRFANLPDILLLYRRHAKAIGIVNKDARLTNSGLIRRRLLESVWPDISEQTKDRFEKAWRYEYFNRRAQRRRMRSEMEQLIERFVAVGWAEVDERPLLKDQMDRHLWQIFPRTRQYWKRLL